MTIELVAPYFSYSTKTGKKLVRLFRQKIFEEVAKSNWEGLIFTYVRNFNKQEDGEYIEEISEIFKAKGWDIYLVELEADINTRLERNKDPHRLKHKASKRNIQESEERLKKYSKQFRTYSEQGEIKEKNYIRINNNILSPQETAKKIKTYFQI